MKEYFGNSLGLVISTVDTENRGRVKVFFPNIMPVVNSQLLQIFGVVGEEMLTFSAAGGNISNGIPSQALTYLTNVLPYCEPASPIIGGSAPGIAAPNGNYQQNAIGGGIYDKNIVGTGNSGIVSQPKQNNVSQSTANPMNGKLNTNDPSQLVSIGGGLYLAPSVAIQWQQLYSAATSAGFKMTVTDAYRDYAAQVSVAQQKGIYGQGGLAANPGHSNHGLGRAVDLEFDNATYNWMLQNAGNYGFTQIHPNIPYGNAEYWHWQVVGGSANANPTPSTPATTSVTNNISPTAPPTDSQLTDPTSLFSAGSNTTNTPNAPVTSATSFGVITDYGYEKAGQADYDSNSANGIGIQDIKLTPNQSFAVSPDVEAQFRAAGIQPTDTVQLTLASGQVVSGTWDDRTSSSLTGRFDFYTPNGRSPVLDQSVVGFSKGDGQIVTAATQVMKTSSLSPIPHDTTNGAKGVFCIPSVGALLWCFFREGNPLFPVYFAASYRSGEWSSAYTTSNLNPGIGNDSSLVGNNSVNKSSIIPNKGGGIISVEGNDQHEFSINSYSGSHLKFLQDSTILYTADDFHSQSDGNKFDISLSNRETHTKGISNIVVNGDSYEKVGNVTDPNTYDTISQIESLISQINDEMLKPT